MKSKRTIEFLSILLLCSAPAFAQSRPDQWAQQTLPHLLGEGGSVVASDDDTLYVAFGGVTRFFYKYVVSSQEWFPLADVPEEVRKGACMAVTPGSLPGESFIYVIPFSAYTPPGGGLRICKSMYRYDTGTDTWTLMVDFIAKFTFNNVSKSVYVLLQATNSNLYLSMTAKGQDLYLIAEPAFAGYPAANPPPLPPAGYPEWGTSSFITDWIRSYGALGSTFLKFTPDPDGGAGSGMWEYKPNFQFSGHRAGSGVSLAWPGTGDHLFCAYAGNTNYFLRYHTAPGTEGWTGSQTTVAGRPPALPLTATTGAALCRGRSNRLFAMCGSSSNTLYEFDPGLNSWGGSPLATLSSTLGDWSSMVHVGGNPGTLHIFRGANSPEYYQYRVGSSDVELQQPSALGDIRNGPSLVVSPDGHLYAVAYMGGAAIHSHLLEYAPSDGLAWWRDRGPLPADMGPGGTLTYDPDGNALFALRGGASTSLWKYPLEAATPAWETMPAPLPAAIGSGAAMIFGGYAAGERVLFVAAGGKFLRYTITLDRWDEMAPLPTGSFGAGSALACPDFGDTVYAATGNGSRQFWTYEKNEGSGLWTQQPDMPVAAGTGSAFCHPGDGRYLYAAIGDSRFYRYDLRDQYWEPKAMVPTALLPGASLAYAPGGPYLYAFGGGSAILQRYLMENGAPAPAHDLRQLKMDGTPIRPGGVLPDRTMLMIRVATSDPDGNRVDLTAEFTGINRPWSEALRFTGSLLPDGTALTIASDLLLGTRYRWRAWTTDSRGVQTSPVDFVTDAESETDVWPRSNAAAAATDIVQVDPASGLAVDSGAEVFINDGIRVQGRISDSDDDNGRLQVKVVPVGGSLSDAPILFGGLVSNGSVASLPLKLAEGDYEWQARGSDEWEGEGEAPWMPATPMRFTVISGGSFGNASCAHQAAPRGSWSAIGLLVLLTAVGRGFRAR